MKILFAIFLILLEIHCYGQPICQIQHFSVDDGLSQSIVQRIIQDKKGFIWFGTWNGLDRYDGYNFKNYKLSSNGENPLTSYRLTYIAETSTGDIWCQSYDEKAFVFDTSEEKFINILKPIEDRLKLNLFVRRIFHSDKGITWIWCKGGYACRVDEKLMNEAEGVTVYSTSNILKGENCFNILVDSDGDEWILTDKGITLLGKKKIDSDFPFKHILEYKKRIYLVSSSNKLAIYDMVSQKLQFLQQSVYSKDILKLEHISNDTLALSTTEGILFYLIKENRFIHVNVGIPGDASNVVRNLYKDSYGDCWVISHTSGVVRINLHTFEKKKYYLDSRWMAYHERKPTTFFYEDVNRTLWILPADGHLCYYDRKSDSLSYYYTELGNKSSVYNPFIRYFMPDRQGNMWLVLNWGLDKLTVLSYKAYLRDIDYGVEIRSFLIDKMERMWVGSKTGFVRIYGETGNFIGYLSDTGKIVQKKVTFSSGIYAIYQDNDENIWIGTKNDGLYRLIKRSDDSYQVSNYHHESNNEYSLSGNSIVSIYQDSKKRIWVACYEAGINMLVKDVKGNISFINYKNQLKSYPADIGLKVRCIAESNNGELLVGTTKGLLTFSSDFKQPEEIKFYYNSTRSNDRTSLPANDVMNILKTSKGDLFLLSFTGGISYPLSDNLLTDRIQFRNYTKKNGLVSELTQSAVENEKDGNIWIVQENAVSKFIVKEERFENYRTSLFKKNMKFSEGMPVITKDGTLCIGSNYGVFQLSVDSIIKNDYVPTLNFTGIHIQGGKEAVLLDEDRRLELQPDERNITFQFAAIDYVNSKDIRYAYRLKGLEDEWNYVDDTRSARYMNIPSGVYEFQVRSTNSDGVWQNNTKYLTVIIKPYFRETIWMWLLYALITLIIICIVVYILFYIYRLRHSIIMEQELADIKLRFFTDISHELRTPLTLITSPLSEVLEHESMSPKARENLQIVEKNAQRMLRLMNQILDFRKIQKGKMKVFLERVNIISSLHSILDSFSSMAYDKHIKVTLDTEFTDLYIWTDSDKFDKIFFNLVSNAFKYTLDGKTITLHIKKTSDSVIITVEDQGVGIDRVALKAIFQRFETLGTFTATPSSGIGLSLVKDLVNILHGTIQVESQVGKGSRFSVTLPITQYAYKNDRCVELVLKDSDETKDESVSLLAGETIDSDMMLEHDDVISILVVEDNAEMRLFLTNILSDSYKVLVADNGEIGLKIARESLPDMILTDVMMPVMDGLDMIRHLKEDVNICHIPIIVLSAKSSLDDRIDALEEGIDDYITKPFSATYLKTRIAQLFKQRKLLQEVYLSRLTEKNEEHVKENEMDFRPQQPKVMDADKVFMQKVMSFLEENMDNPELEIDDFASHLCLGRTVFYRKLKSIVGLTPVEFVRAMRIKRAVQLLDSSDYNFSQIAYMTGFTDPKYFGKCFKKVMGVTPTEYKSNKK